MSRNSTSCTIRSSNVHYRIYNSAPLSHIPDHKFITSFFKICFNIILLCTPRTSYEYFVFFMKLTAKFIVFFSKLARYQIRFGFLTLEDGSDRLSRNVGKELTSTRYVKTQKSTVLILRGGNLQRHSPSTMARQRAENSRTGL